MCAFFPVAFLSGSPGVTELLLVFVVILILFGPRRLPEIARTLGKMLNEVRRASQDFRGQIMSIDATDGSSEAESEDAYDGEIVDEGEDPAAESDDDPDSKEGESSAEPVDRGPKSTSHGASSGQ